MESSLSSVIILIAISSAICLAARKQDLSSPRKIMFKSKSSTSVEVRWRDPDLRGQGRSRDHSRIYIVRYGLSASRQGFKEVYTPSRRHVIDGLEPNRTYDVSVRKEQGGRSGPWSRVQQVTTEGEGKDSSILTSLIGQALSSKTARLSWQTLASVRANITSFSIMEFVGSGRRHKKVLIQGNVRTYLVTGLKPDMLYTIRVRPILLSGRIVSASKIVLRTFTDRPSKPPQSIRLELHDCHENIHVRWQPPPQRSRNGPLAGHKLQYKQQGSRKVHAIVTDRGVRQYIIPDVVKSTKYRVRVSALNVNGSGPYTNWATISVKPPPQDAFALSSTKLVKLKVTRRTDTKVSLIWPTVRNKCKMKVAYLVEISEIKSSKMWKEVSETNKLELTHLNPSSWYMAKVLVLSKAVSRPHSDWTYFSTQNAAPPLIFYHKDALVVEGGAANLTCKARIGRGDKVPNFDWMVEWEGRNRSLSEISHASLSAKTNIQTQTIKRHVVMSSVLIEDFRQGNHVTFYCVAKSRKGIAREKLEASLVVPPTIQSSRSMRVIVDTPAQLECVAMGNPIPDVVWMHPATNSVYKEISYEVGNESAYAASVLEDQNTRRSFLVIRHTTKDNRGPYICVASSNFGSVEAEVELDVIVQPPPAVSNIQITPLSTTRLNVTWSPPENYPHTISFYQVSFRKSEGGQPYILLTRRPLTQLSDLEPQTEYLIGVTAATEHGLGDQGPEVPAKTPSNEGLEAHNFSAVALNSTVIRLSWQPPTVVRPEVIRGYIVFYRTPNNSRVQKMFVPGSRTKTVAITLTKPSPFSARMSTVTTWGYQAFTSWIKIPKYPRAPLPPNRPRDLSLRSTQREITVTWRHPEQSGSKNGRARMEGYRLEIFPRRLPSNSTTYSLVRGSTYYIIEKLEPSTDYVIKLRSQNQYGLSDPVQQSIVTKAYPPSMVLNVTAKAITSTKIHIQWQPPKRGRVTKYHVRYWRPGYKGKQSARLVGNYKNYVAGSLKKNSNYRFEIIPYDGELLGEGFAIFASTLPDKPDKPPRNVVLEATGATTMVASWTPPDPEWTYGRVVAYKLILKVKGGPRVANFEVAGEQTKYTFRDIETTSKYRLRIAAVNQYGTGVFSIPSDLIYPNEPNRPASPKNLVINATDRSLDLFWSQPDFTGAPVFGYIVSYGQFIPDVYREVVDNTVLSHTIKGLKANSEYIVSIRAFNAIGESAPVFRLTRTTPIPEGLKPLQPVAKLTVRSETPESLTLTWEDEVNAKDIQFGSKIYQVRYSTLEGEDFLYINTTNTSIVLSSLKSATLYETSVRSHLGNRSSAWAETVVNPTLQIAPSSPPRNIVSSSVPRYPMLIALNWSEPLHSHGDIQEYIIYLTTDPTLDLRAWAVTSTPHSSVKLGDLIPHTTYFFKIQARNRAGYGPLSETIIHNPPPDRMAAPSAVTVSSIPNNFSTTTVEVAWNEPEQPIGPITGYMIYYSKHLQRVDSEWMVQFERGLDGVLLNLGFNTTYFFKVRVRYSEIVGPFSDVVNYTTPTQDNNQDQAELVVGEDADKKTADNANDVEKNSDSIEGNKTVTQPRGSSLDIPSPTPTDGNERTATTPKQEVSTTEKWSQKQNVSLEDSLINGFNSSGSGKEDMGSDSEEGGSNAVGSPNSKLSNMTDSKSSTGDENSNDSQQADLTGQILDPDCLEKNSNHPCGSSTKQPNVTEQSSKNTNCFFPFLC